MLYRERLRNSPDYLMELIAYARYVTLKNNDAKCVDAPKGRPKEGKGKGKTPERECLKKALRGLCDDVIGSGTLDEIYDARNELLHEASWGRAAGYVDVLEGCAEGGGGDARGRPEAPRQLLGRDG